MARQNRYINSFSEFFTHTKLHQQRVVLLGLWLHRQHPEAFDDVPLYSLESFLRLHDQAKFLPVQGWGIGRPLSFLEHLYRFYGSTGQEDVDSETKRGIIQLMNHLEQKIGDNFLANDRTLCLSDLAVIREKMRLIENIADLVDRGKCPVSREEFGHQLLPASEYLDDLYHRSLAVDLEAHYERIVGPWSYENHLRA